MKIKCIDNSNPGLAKLTIGSIYDAIEEDEIHYRALDDLGAPKMLFKSRFEIVEYPMPKEAYVSTGGAKCPYCGGDDIDGGFTETNSGEATQPMSCSGCGKDWQDNYKLIGYEER